jgi:colicin import membrane protein
MHAYVYPSRQEKAISGAFAFGMHLVFLALLMFGVTWQKRVEPQANIVDLWASLPSPAPPKVEPPPPPPEPVVKPEPKPKPVEPPPVKVAPKPDVAKPDIAMKKKAEKDKAEKEKAEKERRALEEKQKEAKKRDAEAKAAQKREKEKEVEAQRLAREQEDAQRRIAQQQASARDRLVNDYTERIKARIKRFVVLPPNLQGNPQADFDVVLLPGGEVLSVKLKRASGNAAYDSAVERAIHKAAPLPLPPDPAMFREFRELNLTFRPQE